MNKAFTRETDAEAEPRPDAQATLPAGSKNYMTPRGYQRLMAELKELLRQERPELVRTIQWAAGNGDRSENGDYIYGKRRLREIDRRIRFLTQQLENAEVVDNADRDTDQIFFGATVEYAKEGHPAYKVSIVGLDEIAVENGYISWRSPLAQALMTARPGEVVHLNTPAGPEEIEVLSVCYRDLE